MTIMPFDSIIQGYQFVGIKMEFKTTTYVTWDKVVYLNVLPKKIGNTYVPIPNYQKLLACMILATEHTKDVFTFQRLCAFRLYFVFEERLYDLVTNMCHAILDKNRRYLSLPEWQQVLNGFKTKESLYGIYLGDPESRTEYKLVL
jgi:hypothetical protein